MSKGFLSCESFDVVCETLAHNLESVARNVRDFKDLYEDKDYNMTDPRIRQCLLDALNHVQKTQECIKSVNKDVRGVLPCQKFSELKNLPEFVDITLYEFVMLYDVFEKHTRNLESSEFSLFSSRLLLDNSELCKISDDSKSGGEANGGEPKCIDIVGSAESIPRSP